MPSTMLSCTPRTCADTDGRTIFSTLLKDHYGFGEIIIGVCYMYVPSPPTY